jgi:Holliday junction DNA helicase RuvA
MIATLSGVVSEKLADMLVLDVHGIGYGLQVTAEDFGRLPTGEVAKLYIYEHVREQSYEGIVMRPGVNTGDEAVEALISLGYSPQDATVALKDIDASLPTEERIKLALKG